MRAKLVGIQIDCPKAGLVTVARPNFVVGPRSDWPKLFYTAKCECGEIHRIPMKVPSVRVTAKLGLSG